MMIGAVVFARADAMMALTDRGYPSAPRQRPWLGHAEYVPRSASEIGITQVNPVAGPVLKTA
jgi:hypothetical protein